MNRKNKIILGVVLVAILLMGIGYAALNNVTLNINVSANASADPSNFKVVFTGNQGNAIETAVKPEVTVTANTDTAGVTFNGLTTKGQVANAILEIENTSEDIDAKSVTVTAGGLDETSEYFKITAQMCNADGGNVTENSLAAGTKTYVKISAEVMKNPTTDNVQKNIVVTVTATPDTTPAS